MTISEIVKRQLEIESRLDEDGRPGLAVDIGICFWLSEIALQLAGLNNALRTETGGKSTLGNHP